MYCKCPILPSKAFFMTFSSPGICPKPIGAVPSVDQSAFVESDWGQTPSGQPDAATESRMKLAENHERKLPENKAATQQRDACDQLHGTRQDEPASDKPRTSEAVPDNEQHAQFVDLSDLLFGQLVWSFVYPPAATRYEDVACQQGKTAPRKGVSALSTSEKTRSGVVRELLIAMVVLLFPLMAVMVVVFVRSCALLMGMAPVPFKLTEQEDLRALATQILHELLESHNDPCNQDNVELWQDLFYSLYIDPSALLEGLMGEFAVNEECFGRCNKRSSRRFSQLIESLPSLRAVSSLEGTDTTDTDSTDSNHSDAALSRDETLVLFRPYCLPEIIYPAFPLVYQPVPSPLPCAVTSPKPVLLIKLVMLPSNQDEGVEEIFDEGGDTEWYFGHRKAYFKPGMFNFALILMCSPGNVLNRRRRVSVY